MTPYETICQLMGEGGGGVMWGPQIPNYFTLQIPNPYIFDP